MADTLNSYVSKYSGDQLDAAIAALSSLQQLFASKADFDKFVDEFTAKMNEFITAANTSASKAEAATAATINATKEMQVTTAKISELVTNGNVFFENIN